LNAFMSQSPSEQKVAPPEAASTSSKPAWVDRYVWTSLWKVVVVGIATAVLLFVASQTSHLLVLLGVSVFFALALIPGVNHIHDKWGWRRGAAVGLMYAALAVFSAAMILVLIPAIGEFASQVSNNADDWVAQINDTAQNLIGRPLIDRSATADTSQAGQALSGWAGEILGLASTGVGFAFDLLTVAMFTFYFAADYPRILRATLARMPARRQRIVGWVVDTSIEQTGGYFYSRLLLMLVNGTLSFGVMLLLGLDVGFALPLALFMGFVSEFIPAIGTYLGAAVPVLVVFVELGLTSALILIAWAVVYQQVENLLLSPRLSADTMTLNGAVAFGAALAGGAIAGPMGAFVALPVAALITAMISNSGRTYDVVYHGRFDSEDPTQAAVPSSGASAGHGAS
jgi:predicted PurR-regulated permease PerM